jgi:hypothetical protein
MARSRQRSAAPLRGSTCGARILAVGSSPAISTVSSRSSCLLLRFRARVAVLARALFLAMNSSSCRAWRAPPRWSARRARGARAGIRETRRSCRGTSSACRATDRACGCRWPRNARSCETIRQASLKFRRKCSSRICVRRSRKFVGSSSSSRFGSCSSSAASLTRVCQPPESLASGPRGRPLQLELAGDFAAFPVGLAAVAHQKLERRLARQERIVLPQVAEPQLGMADHFAAVEFFFAQQHTEQRRLARAVAADEADLHVVGDRRLGAVEQDLIAVALVSVLDLQHATRAVCFSGGIRGAGGGGKGGHVQSATSAPHRSHFGGRSNTVPSNSRIGSSPGYASFSSCSQRA